MRALICPVAGRETEAAEEDANDALAAATASVTRLADRSEASIRSIIGVFTKATCSPMLD